MNAVALLYQVVDAVGKVLHFIAVIIYLVKKLLIVMFFYSVFFREYHVICPLSLRDECKRWSCRYIAVVYCQPSAQYLSEHQAYVFFLVSSIVRYQVVPDDVMFQMFSRHSVKPVYKAFQYTVVCIDTLNIVCNVILLDYAFIGICLYQSDIVISR